MCGAIPISALAQNGLLAVLMIRLWLWLWRVGSISDGEGNTCRLFCLALEVFLNKRLRDCFVEVSINSFTRISCICAGKRIRAFVPWYICGGQRKTWESVSLLLWFGG